MIRKFVSPTISPIFLSTSSVPGKDHNSITDGKGKGSRKTKPKINSNEISDISIENQYKVNQRTHNLMCFSQNNVRPFIMINFF